MSTEEYDYMSDSDLDDEDDEADAQSQVSPQELAKTQGSSPKDKTKAADETHQDAKTSSGAWTTPSELMVCPLRDARQHVTSFKQSFFLIRVHTFCQ